jgi:nucleotide-binding universal stress UspA family protein
MHSIKHILYPTNLSEASQEALRYTCAFAKVYNASITLIHVVKPMVDLGNSSIAQFQLMQLARQRAEQELEAFVQPFRIHKINFILEVTSGYAREQIAAYANDKKEIDLILIATNDSFSLEKVFYGSVVTNSIQHTNKPVLVVPKGLRFRHIEQVAYLKPRGSASSNRADGVDELVRHFGAALHELRHCKDIEGNNLETEITYLDDYRLALQTFIYKKKIELLVTRLPQLNAFQRWLGLDTTKRIALKSTIPVLLLK